MRTTRWNRSMRGCTALAALLVAAVAGAAGCGAAGGVSPSASVNTAVQGWEHYFRLEWAPRPTASGTLIDGYVHNTYGSSMSNVRLLAQALDAQNNVVGQRIEWVPGIVPNFDRAYFRIPGLPPADHYRVSVWSFDILQADDNLRP